MKRFLQIIGFVALWSALAAATYFLTSPSPEIKEQTADQTDASKSSAPTKPPQSETLSGILSAPSATERWDRMEQALETMEPRKLKQWYVQAEEMVDHELKKTIQERVLCAWVHADPDGVWKHFNQSHIPKNAFMRCWMHSGDIDDLIARIEKFDENSYRSEWMLEPLFAEMAHQHPDQIDKLDVFLKRDPNGLAHAKALASAAKASAAARRGDRETVLALLEEDSSTGSNLYQHLFYDNPSAVDEALIWLDRIPEKHRLNYVSALISHWPKEKNPSALFAFAFDKGSFKAHKTYANAMVKIDLPEEHITFLTKQIFEPESGFDASDKVYFLSNLARNHPKIARKMLPELDPFRAGILIEEIGANWERSDFEGALEWSQTLTGIRREAFIKKTLSNAFDDSEALFSWFREQPPEFLERVDAIEQLEGQIYEAPIDAINAARHLSPEHQQELFEYALGRYYYRNHAQRTRELKEAFPQLTDKLPQP